MLRVLRFSDRACFLTGSREDVVDVKLEDRSFAGSISWAALLDVLRRKAAETEADEGNQARKGGSTTSSTPGSAGTPSENQSS